MQPLWLEIWGTICTVVKQQNKGILQRYINKGTNQNVKQQNLIIQRTNTLISRLVSLLQCHIYLSVN